MSDDIILQLLKEVRDEQREHGKELAKQSQVLDVLEKDVKKNTEDLSYHIHRTDLLEDLHKDNKIRIDQTEQRLEILEAPIKAAEYVGKRWKAYTGTIIVILTIITLFIKFKEYL